MVALEGNLSLHILPPFSCVHLHRKCSIFRLELNHAQQVQAGAGDPMEATVHWSIEWALGYLGKLLPFILERRRKEGVDRTVSDGSEGQYLTGQRDSV
jgi:hypothetical protein